MALRLLVATVSIIVLLGGCAKSEDATQVAVTSESGVDDNGADGPKVDDGTEIRWYEGDIDDAFALAKQQGKPLFLYWGADWCPYCKELEATIFVRDEFIKLSHQFIAVDLSNGDSETIRYSDRFKMYSLPTVIVFSPEGEELTRIRGGINLEEYASVLELTLNEVRPVAELVAAATTGNTLSSDDWEMLAGYSWGQDRGQALGEDDPLAIMTAVWDACPDTEPSACSALAIDTFGVWLSEAEEENVEEAAVYVDAVQGILADPALAKTNLPSLAVYGSYLVDNADEETGTALQAALLALFKPAVEDLELGTLKRANVLSGYTDTAVALLDEEATLPESDIAWIKGYADELVAALTTYEVHAGINQLWGIYYTLDLVEDARATLMVGIERSRAPYYFMSGMAYIERQAENPEAAIGWYKQAWEATRLPLDRARWGGGYVSRLTTMTPDNTAEIQRAASTLMADFASQKNGLENYAKRIERVEGALLDWATEPDPTEPDTSELDATETSTTEAAETPEASTTDASNVVDWAARAAVIEALQAQMTTQCEPFADATESPAVCDRFLIPDVEEPDETVAEAA